MSDNSHAPMYREEKALQCSYVICTSFFPWDMLTEQQRKPCIHVHGQTDSSAAWEVNAVLTQLLPFSARRYWEAGGDTARSAAAETGAKQNCRDCSLQPEFLLLFSGKI